MEITIPYCPHPKQKEVHDSKVRFKVVAAGRRGGKTVLAVNDGIKTALSHPQTIDGPIERTWIVCTTYKQAEMVAWRMLLKYLPEQLIKVKRGAPHLSIELINGHIIELKGSENYDRLRGVALRKVILEEYGLMAPEVWTEVIRPMLVDTGGEALFIGTPGPDGSPHFHEIFNLGKTGQPDWKSWMFFTKDNPYIDKAEIEKAKKELPPDIFKREFEADFDITAGLIYDNFRHNLHVIPNYEPNPRDFIVGSVDPGLMNPTGAILTAWGQDGVGRIFWEYYEKDKLASENALAMFKHIKTNNLKVGYWVIDRASRHRDQATGITVFDKYQEVLRPMLCAPNNPDSVWAGIDEVKKLLHPSPGTNKPRLQVSAMCRWWLWEVGRYIRYKHKWRVEKNEEEKPRKLNDHLMDATRNMVYSKPWIRPSIHMHVPTRSAYPV